MRIGSALCQPPFPNYYALLPSLTAHSIHMPSRLAADKTRLSAGLMEERILVLDGAMGTQIQALGLDEAAVRGERFADHHKDLKNFPDILALTRPADLTAIHRRYFEAGADI